MRAVNVLGVIHGEKARAGVFAEVVEQRGHRLEDWSLAWATPPPRPLADYSAVLVFGGSMHADQDEHHPWLREENDFIRGLLARKVPMLGVCLGAQLQAKASGSPVGPASEPEIGWYEVELLPEGADDPVLGALPARFHAFQWHFYTYGVPEDAVELARSRVCTQAFRLGESAWGIQFHAEVTERHIHGWMDVAADDLVGPRHALERETRERIAGWNELGRRLCSRFVEVAERVAAPV
jgi:GMP synthase-like glutamine amidotransferase